MSVICSQATDNKQYENTALDDLNAGYKLHTFSSFNGENASCWLLCISWQALQDAFCERFPGQSHILVLPAKAAILLVSLVHSSSDKDKSALIKMLQSHPWIWNFTSEDQPNGNRAHRICLLSVKWAMIRQISFTVNSPLNISKSGTQRSDGQVGQPLTDCVCRQVYLLIARQGKMS